MCSVQPKQGTHIYQGVNVIRKHATLQHGSRQTVHAPYTQMSLSLFSEDMACVSLDSLDLMALHHLKTNTIKMKQRRDSIQDKKIQETLKIRYKCVTS